MLYVNDSRDASPTVTRRALLRVATVVAGSLLAACSSPSPASAPTSTSGGLAAAPTSPPKPTAAPAPTSAAPTTSSAATTTAAGATTGTAAARANSAGANADGVIPSPAADVPEAYLKLPPQFQSVAAVPGKGSKVTAAFISYNPPVPPRDQNLYWQELEKRLGILYEPNIIPADSYREKMAALVAGGDLPDLTGVEQLNAPDLLKTVNQGAFTDLTSYLDGDALKSYANLAKIPDYAWRNVRIKKKIYGVPIPRFIPDRALYFHEDWLQKLGAQKPKNADEFLNLMVRFTKEDPAGHGKADQFGLGGYGSASGGLWYAFPFFTMMFRAPHTWRANPDGTLTHQFETPEYRNAIEFMKRLNDAGVYHPDAASMTIQQAKDAFLAGQFGGYADGWNGIQSARFNFRKIDPNNPAAAILVPPGFDGRNPAVERSQGFFGMTCIPAKIGKDQERVKELLRIIDYAQAPFGSEEYMFLRFGLPGVHYELQNDGPVLNDRGRTEIGSLSSGIGRRNDIFYYPDAPDDARLMQQWCKEQVQYGIDNPTYGLYSPTAIAKGSELQALTVDRMTSIISGREPLSIFDTFVSDWRSRGGDQIRKEYEQELKG